MDISTKFGKRVRAIRLKKEMTQTDLAEKLRVSRNYISRIETGVENMSLKNIEKLARVLGVRPDTLLR
jgi:transcriptional regulator with XRE-family HTH domain